MNADIHSAQTNIHELFIARDVIDMAKDYAEDYYVLEYLSDFAFNLARLYEDSAVDWDSIFSVLDQAYSRKDSAVLGQLTTIYNKVVAQIDASK